MKTVYDGTEGDIEILLGNEAIVRGALEGGVEVATTYPGTPASEIGDTFSLIARAAGIYFEYSSNEKVALEIAAAANACGLRALTAMKHVGLNVAADAFVSLAHVGVVGGHIVVVADDPGMHSSQNEQDTRRYAQLAGVPVLEPTTPQEAKEFTARAFTLSEELELPVLLRTTTRVSHVRGPVVYGHVRPPAHPDLVGAFSNDTSRFVLTPANARVRKRVLLEKMEAARSVAETDEFNRVVEPEGPVRVETLGILTSSVSFGHTMEALHHLGLSVPVLRLGMPLPFPSKKVSEFAEGLDLLLVVEELDPILENETLTALRQSGVDLPVCGKYTSHVRISGELRPDDIMTALWRILGVHHGEGVKEEPLLKEPGVAERLRMVEEHRVEPALQEVLDSIQLPSRPPVMCPGCPHRATFYCIQKAVGKDIIVSTDIGCYTLGVQPPFNMGHYQLCMGSSVGTAGGFSRATEQMVVAIIGDSTFFHSGIPPLVNAVHNKHPFLLVVVDNRTTAMTGHQPHPGISMDGMGESAPRVSIEECVMGTGVEFVEAADPVYVKETVEVMKEAVEYIRTHNRPAVVISKHPCILLEVRRKRHHGEKITRYYVDQEQCRKCRICIDGFGCPAFFVYDGNIFINRNQCYGCSVCATVCPFGAIHPEGD